MSLREHLEGTYLKDILKDASNKDLLEIKKLQNINTRNRLLFVSAIYIIGGLYYFISNLSHGLFDDIIETRGTLFSFIAFIIMLSASVLALAYTIIINKRPHREVQIVSFIYAILMESSMVLFLVNDLYFKEPDYVVVLFNFILISMCPIYNVWLSAIAEAYPVIWIYSAMAVIRPDANFQQVTLILFSCIIATQYLRIVKTKGMYQQIKLEQISEQFKYISTMDFLTGLSNRTALDDYLKKEIASAISQNSYISITMVDIDDFKSYNDHYSHMEGDKILRAVGDIIRGVNNNYFHAFRYGGEEFLIIGIDEGENELALMNEAILNGVRDLRLDRSEIKSVMDYVTVSIGSARAICHDMDDFMRLLKISDDRLYESKNSGKNKITMK